jgi:hypothetical protein
VRKLARKRFTFAHQSYDTPAASAAGFLLGRRVADLPIRRGRSAAIIAGAAEKHGRYSLRLFLIRSITYIDQTRYSAASKHTT